MLMCLDRPTGRGTARSSALIGLLVIALHGDLAEIYQPAPLTAMTSPLPVGPGSATHPEAGLPSTRNPRYAEVVQDAAQYLNLEPALIHAVIAAESAYDPEAVSHRGAIGLMQLIPESGARDAYRYLYTADGIPTAEGLRRPDVNIWLGSAYLRLLIDHHLTDVPEPAKIPLALAAYNWGVGNLQAVLAGEAPQSLEEALAFISLRCPAVTARYVAQVLSEQGRLASSGHWSG
jgi:soluble lytic murein transglycosylase-like protein